MSQWNVCMFWIRGPHTEMPAPCCYDLIKGHAANHQNDTNMQYAALAAGRWVLLVASTARGTLFAPVRATSSGYSSLIDSHISLGNASAHINSSRISHSINPINQSLRVSGHCASFFANVLLRSLDAAQEYVVEIQEDRT